MCTFCRREMLQASSCSEASLQIRGSDYEPIRWGDETGHIFWERSARCGDCGVAKGGVHHHGCDLEQCPICERQAISCGCFDDD